MLFVSNEELREALVNFYKVTGLKIVLYDAERNGIATYPEYFVPYCEAVRTSKELAQRCAFCDKMGFDECEKTRAPYLYKCHMNIREAIAPILANEVIIGYLMFGQVLCDEDRKEAIESACKAAEIYGFEKEDFLNKLESMGGATKDYLISALKIMSMCAGYLYTSEIIKNSTDALAYQLRDYVNTHLSEDLTSKTICNRFFISRSKLYKISTSEFGMGIMDYIRTKRVEQAKKTLLSTNLPIIEVAAHVGFSDVNYFIRTFKKSVGTTPNKYRKNSSSM